MPKNVYAYVFRSNKKYKNEILMFEIGLPLTLRQLILI